MKKKYIYNRIYKKMDLRISLLNFNFVMIHIIHEILVLIKNHIKYLKDNIFEFSLKKYFYFYNKRRLLFFKKN